MTDNTLANGRLAAPFAGLRARLGALLDNLVETSQGMQCTREYERLSRLSDEELARMGLRRDTLVLHAFRRFGAA